jgi:RHS repeat-associated protein
VYLGTDILGSVRSATGEAGTLEGRYEYDAFGRPYKGDLDGGMNLGYTGKPYDSRTGLYNYGYRDYEPGTARFTTVDPVRDGSNWFAYVNNDPVNYTDPWGLSTSDRSRNAEEDDSTYTAQTVQYNFSVYHYESQVIHSLGVLVYPEIMNETRYSYDLSAITSERNTIISNFKELGFAHTRGTELGQDILHHVNTRTNEVRHITIGQIQQAPSLPASLKSPKPGKVLGTPGTAIQNGFPR